MDAVLFPTQIIVIKELNPKEHLWLKALSDGMEKEQMKNLLETIEGINLKFDRELADSVLQVSIQANKQVVEELRGDENMCQALLEIMEPEINKIKETVREEVTKEVTKEVTEQERQKGIRSLITFLKESGQGDSEIRNAIVKVYDVPANEVEKYL